ncbi:hypothetical protein [Sphingobacterium siyangense]|uniref:hypothetical protein n=1 Tax=Sphingobacterium siyangense TaxID=459529 RepID=UPI0019652C25|nr:hypothetical protein [Sphingobacterium siyangense]QRY58271.1 hypothetical protein JVX97_02000 [Sphingobacterium siyangense]
MKTNKENLAKLNGRLSYEAPRVSVQTVELEQGIAAGSGVNGEMSESKNVDKQTGEFEW